MQMTEGEIKTNVLQAKDQRAQIKICAELNAVDEEEIKSILRTQGVDLRTLKGANDGSRASRAKKQLAAIRRIEGSEQPVTETAAPETDPVGEISRRIRELVTVRDCAEAELKQLRDKLSSLIEAIG